MQYMGLFYARDPRAMLANREAPYYIIGRHALSAADCASDGGAVACAQGRLRNSAALRAALSSSGIRPVDGSLSALVLAAYRLWGEDYPARLGGPVSTVVIDQDAGRLVLSRDRMGEMPVFYAYRGGSMAFSDHPAKLLDAPQATRIVGREGLCELFGIGPARTPCRTPWKDILSLPPGHALIAGGHGHKVKRYFALEPLPHEDDLKHTIETVRFLCEQAVADALPLRPAVMLSGGLDSSVLAALMARRMDRPVESYSVDYEENELYEAPTAFQPERDAPYVLLASEHLKTRHNEVTLTIPDLMASLDEAMALRGIPGMADIDAALMLFTRKIAQEHPAVVSGECGDEVFGGYPWFHRRHLIEVDGFPWSGSLLLREQVLKPKVRELLAPGLRLGPLPRGGGRAAPAFGGHSGGGEASATARPVLSVVHAQPPGARAAHEPGAGPDALLRRPAGTVCVQRALVYEEHGRHGEGASPGSDAGPLAGGHLHAP